MIIFQFDAQFFKNIEVDENMRIDDNMTTSDALLLVCCVILYDFLINVFKELLSGIPPGCKTNWNPDQARPSIGHGLGPNCLQRLSADDKCSN